MSEKKTWSAAARGLARLGDAAADEIDREKLLQKPDRGRQIRGFCVNY
jgi:hypothetical protein